MELSKADLFEAARICTAPSGISDCDVCPLNNWPIEKEGQEPSVSNYDLCIDYLISQLTTMAKYYTCQNCEWHDDFSWVCCNGLSVCRGDFTDNNNSCSEWEKKISH